ncbi:MAG: hypothetical protein JNK05_28575 [Myxococcales bacterium]|nr:hypothetical protein [Myxococcales bacterium]
MIRVMFVTPSLDGPPTDDDAAQRWWRAWLAKAERARDAFEKSRKTSAEPEFNSAVWKELKEWLMQGPFQGKCGYCESLVTTNDYGDAEHYRPKGAVNKLDGGSWVPVVVGRKPHGGYWWLAYDWTNLFPACAKCNSGHKGENFPTAKTHVRATSRTVKKWTSDALDKEEEPLLLHPMRAGEANDPERHITFDIDGRAVPVDSSARARATIDTCGLNRDDGPNSLAEARRETMSEQVDLCLHAWVQSKFDAAAIDLFLAELRRRKRPYIGAVTVAIKRRLREIERRLAERAVK